MRGNDIRIGKDGKFSYPGRGITLNWDNEKMKTTNLSDVNAFVKRTYKDGYTMNF